MIQTILENNIDTFTNDSSELLFKNEAANSILISVAMMIKESQNSGVKVLSQPTLFKILSNNQTSSVAILNSYSLILTFATDEEIIYLVNFIIENKIQIPRVLGPAKESTLFSQKYSELANINYKTSQIQRILKLEKVKHPNHNPGIFREAYLSEIETLIDFQIGFMKDALADKPIPSRKEIESLILNTLKNNQAYVLEYENKIVSSAYFRRPSKNGVAISWVYTPPEFRKRGFCSQLMAELSDHALKSGKTFCCLYTDATNPTSNKVYENVGYEFVIDSAEYIFINKKAAI